MRRNDCGIRAACGMALWACLLWSANPAFGEDGPFQVESSGRKQLAYEDLHHPVVKKSGLKEGELISSLDGSKQPFRYWTPKAEINGPRPLLIFLHSWNSDYRQYKEDWLQVVAQRHWIFIQPNFRGANDNPEAGGSPQARQDVLDCVDWAIENLGADSTRIYLAGASGGGHLAMLLAGRHPERFTAVSAWVGISDLAEWYRFHLKGAKEGYYAQMVARVCGGPPGQSPEVDAQYRDRSPITWIQDLGDLPLDLAAGVHDGKRGSVPIQQTLNVFNVIARMRGVEMITPDEISELRSQGNLLQPSAEDVAPDDSFEREIKLRRHAGSARVTIFEGGHEGLPKAACDWLAGHCRPTTASSVGISSQGLDRKPVTSK